MYTHLKALALSTLLMVPASVGAMAQTAAAPTPSTPPTPRGGFGAWISGHPYVDFVVVLAIVAVIAATYFRRQGSRV